MKVGRGLINNEIDRKWGSCWRMLGVTNVILKCVNPFQWKIARQLKN